RDRHRRTRRLRSGQDGTAVLQPAWQRHHLWRQGQAGSRFRKNDRSHVRAGRDELRRAAVRKGDGEFVHALYARRPPQPAGPRAWPLYRLADRQGAWRHLEGFLDSGRDEIRFRDAAAGRLGAAGRYQPAVYYRNVAASFVIAAIELPDFRTTLLNCSSDSFRRLRSTLTCTLSLKSSELR